MLVSESGLFEGILAKNKPLVFHHTRWHDVYPGRGDAGGVRNALKLGSNDHTGPVPTLSRWPAVGPGGVKPWSSQVAWTAPLVVFPSSWEL